MYGNREPGHPKRKHPLLSPKTWLMSSRQIINRSIIIGFMILIGFALAKAINNGSFMGILLALVSLGAAVYFLYIVAKAQQEMEEEKI
jgi:hypothetical protein